MHICRSTIVQTCAVHIHSESSDLLNRCTTLVMALKHAIASTATPTAQEDSPCCHEEVQRLQATAENAPQRHLGCSDEASSTMHDRSMDQEC